MASAIIDGTSIDLSVFSYSAPKPNPTGGKVVNLYNKHFKESLTIAVPLMSSWGAQEVKEVVGKSADGKAVTNGTGKYTMALQFANGQYSTPEADAFLEQMKLVEQKIKEDAMTYSKEWFGKEIKSMEVMDEKISPMLKYPRVSRDSEERDYNRKPQLTLKLPCWKGVWQTSIFDEDYNPLYVKGKSSPDTSPLDYLKCASKAPLQVICLIQCSGLWFVGNPAKVSITWNLKQAIVKKPKTSVISDDICVLTLRQSDKEALKSMPEPDVLLDERNNSNAISVQVEDSDDEDYVLPLPKQQQQIKMEEVKEEIQTIDIVKPAILETSVEEIKEEPIVMSSSQSSEPKKKTVVKKVKKAVKSSVSEDA